MLLAAALVLALASSLAPPASAQSPRDWPSPSGGPANTRGSFNLDTLFGALKIAPDEASAKAIEDRIWALWQASGSDTVDLLMTRVKQASDAGNYDLALRLLDADHS